MATRENQTLQVFVGLFGLAIVVLALLTYWFFKKWDESDEIASQRQTSLNSANMALSNLQDEANGYKAALGFAAEDTAQDIMAQIEADREKFGRSSVEVGTASYRELTSLFFNALKASENAASAAADRADALDAELQAAQRRADTQAAEFQRATKALTDSYNEEKARLNQQLAELRTRFDTTFSQNQTDLTELDATNRNNLANIAKLEQELEDVNLFNQTLSDQVRGLEDESFEVPDGQVEFVNQRLGIAWINLGSADGLRPGVSFSVYDKDENDAAFASKKGTLEVTKILGPNMAEARIEDKIDNPVLRNDKIYSPAWNRGEQIHFGLAGIIDIEGDGVNDRDIVVDLITRSDGVVDDVLTLNTRYLIDGGPPEPGRTLSEDDREAAAAYSEMIRQADRLGIRRVPLKVFLDNAGYDPYAARTVSMGKGTNPDLFPARDPRAIMPRRTPTTRSMATPQQSRLRP